MVVPAVTDSTVTVYVVSDSLEEVTGVVQLSFYKFDGTSLGDTVVSVKIPMLSSQKVLDIRLKRWLSGYKKSEIVLQAAFRTDVQSPVLTERLFYLKSPRELALPRPVIRRVVKETENRPNEYTIMLQADSLAHSLILSSQSGDVFSDNYFDLMPFRKKTVTVKSNLDLQKFTAAFTVTALAYSREQKPGTDSTAAGKTKPVQ